MAEGTTAKRTIRTKKAADIIEEADVSSITTPKPIPAKNPFTNLLEEISKLQAEFESLIKEITQTREDWLKEQENHQREVVKRSQELEFFRKRDEESYQYETLRARQKTENDFADRKASWEKELRGEKEVIEKDHQELLGLRKIAETFPLEKEKAVKEAESLLQKQLIERFTNEKTLREQEVKAERDILNLKITNLTSENSRQAAEIISLKKALEEAIQQVKDVALKVIEGRSNQARIPSELPV